MADRKKGRSKKKKDRKGIRALAVIVILLIVILAIFFSVRSVRRQQADASAQSESEEAEVLDPIDAAEPDLEVELLTVNPYSRPGIELPNIDGIVIHYTANPGSDADANRNYFEGLKDSHTAKASAHFIVGLDGKIVQCIPTDEIAYASNSRNTDTIAIECCYENEDGSFNQATYDSVVDLTAWLCAREGLTADDVIRHYDITGKMCPLYYVEHPEEWEQFLADVDARINEINGQE